LQALRGRGPARLPARFAANGFQYQALEVARCVAEGLGESPVMPLDESVALMRLVDEARAQMGVEVPA
ncbi:MAG: gfo/Idh/MocA family oxidoreductase, partial [Pseudomonadota bacterium]